MISCCCNLCHFTFGENGFCLFVLFSSAHTACTLHHNWMCSPDTHPTRAEKLTVQTSQKRHRSLTSICVGALLQLTTRQSHLNVQVGPGLQCRLTSPRRLYTKLHLSRELELKTRESCLLGISARNEGQNSPSADKNQKFGMHSITFAPHRPQQKENHTNIGGSIEKCGAIGKENEKPERYSQQSRKQNT